MGPDAGINEGNYDFAVVADFDDADGYLGYRDHPAHRAVVDKHITPIVATRAASSTKYRPGQACPAVKPPRRSERLFWKLHEVEAGLLGDLPFRRKPGQHGRGEEPGGGDLARRRRR